MSYEEAGRVYPSQFETYMLARNVDLHDRKGIASFQAWQTVRAKATDKNGKSVYKDYSEFYDSEKEFKHMFFPESTEKVEARNSIADINKRLNERG